MFDDWSLSISPASNVFRHRVPLSPGPVSAPPPIPGLPNNPTSYAERQVNIGVSRRVYELAFVSQFLHQIEEVGWVIRFECDHKFLVVQSERIGGV